MFSGLSIGVVIPAYNEERFIARTLRRIPPFVDEIIVIDDSSRDRTFHEAVSAADSRTRIVRHETNQGVGGAIVTGYREALARNLDVAVVMAGDGQI
ncbi:MAG: glycosyltransferase family 2 protein, partial [Deltaproteobacteria bacterium]|nr:glycosyltransferase family 2 protein [Deltaproteobacteria bacterium]